MVLLTDIHQHIWTGPLLEALEARDRLPFVRRERELTILHSAGEAPYVIDVAAEQPHKRAQLLSDDNVDVACIAISSPIGIEALPKTEAQELIAAHAEGIEALPNAFMSWAAVALDEPDADDVDHALTARSIGISLPAGAIAGLDALEHARPLLARAEARGVPVFVHPGPGPGTRPRRNSLSDPLWWTALTDYVAQMQAAWLTFAAIGAREHPELEVVFAMLAGGAPLLSERLVTRGGPRIDVRDHRVFYETSSYGPVAVEAMARRVGPSQLLYGSDRPVVEPARTGREAILQSNAERFVDRVAA